MLYFLGLLGLLLLGVPVAIALMAVGLAYILFTIEMDPLIAAQRVATGIDSFPLLAIPFFMLAAELMNSAGITDRIFRLAKAMVGAIPGGLAHVNVLASMLFAGMSGSAVADAAGLGRIEIKAMKDDGYDADFAAAVTAASATIGPIIPPSISAVIYGLTAGVSIGGLFAAGLIPGILMGLSMMALIAWFSARRGYGRGRSFALAELAESFRRAFLALMTPVIIVGGIVGGFFTPTEASAIAVLYSLLLGGLIYRTVGLDEIPRVLYDSARFAAISLFCIGTASAFGWILAYFKIPQQIVDFLAPFGVGPISTGFIVAGAFLFIGMFIDAIPAIIILGTVLWPLAEVAQMHPIHFAIIGVISLAFGLVTPPYGLCLLIACAIGEIKVHQALGNVIIVLAPMLLVLLLVILLPELILALPRWIMPRFL